MHLQVRGDEYDEECGEWRMQSNEIAKLMGKETDKWSNFVGDTLSDVKEFIEKEQQRDKLITQLFDLK